MPKFSISSIKKEDIEGAIASGALITSAILPHGDIDGLNLCPHYYLTGQECPFCGMTRGFVAISHLDPVSAVEFNPGTPLIYAAFVIVLIRSLWSWKNNQLSNLPKFPNLVTRIWTLASIAIFGYVLFVRWIVPLVNL